MTLAPVRLRTVHLPAPAKVKRLTAKARPAPREANEQPRYPALRDGIARQQRKTAEAMVALRRDWLAVIGRQPEKAEGAKNLNVEDLREIDAAIEAFMVTMAGPRPRDRQTFAVSDQAVVQETNHLAHRIGVERGAGQVGVEPNTELTRLQRMRLNERAFDRLSEAGRLRFEGGLGTIRGAMLEGFDAGANPLAIARELGEAFESYESVWLTRLVRTEMAMASERAIVDTYREAGVRQFTVEGDPGTDATCVGYQEGGPYDLDNTEALPPYHPNCFCSISPYVPE